MANPLSPEEIARTIINCDRAFAPTIDRVGAPPVRRNVAAQKRYASLIESVTSQLLSVKAGDTIYGRIKESCGGVVTPETILATGFDPLRAAGLSGTKTNAMLDLAERALDGRLNLANHSKMTSAAVSQELLSVKGVGPWTVEMYLLFSLARHDVWPHLDFGVRAGWSIIHDLPEMISVKEVKGKGEKFPEVQSEVAWYCWRALEHSRNQGD